MHALDFRHKAKDMDVTRDRSMRRATQCLALFIMTKRNGRYLADSCYHSACENQELGCLSLPQEPPPEAAQPEGLRFAALREIDQHACQKGSARESRSLLPRVANGTSHSGPLCLQRRDECTCTMRLCGGCTEVLAGPQPEVEIIPFEPDVECSQRPARSC